jgi:PAS domain S-box-containing protein
MKETARFFTNINCIGWAPFSSFFLWFTAVLTDRKKLLKSRLFYFFLSIPPIILIIAQWNGILVCDWKRQIWGWASVWSGNYLTYFFYSYYLSYMVLSLCFMFNYIRKTKSTLKKKQVKIIFFSTTIPLVLGTLTDVVLPRLNIHGFPDLANVFTLIWAAGIVIAIIRFSFFTPTPAMAAENIISTMTDSLILLDPDGIIVKANNATLDLLGYHKKELEGHPIDRIFSDENFKTEKLNRIIKGEEVIKNSSLSLTTKKGRHVPVNFSTSVLYEEGAFAGLVCIAQDVTPHIKAAEIMKRSRDELEIKVQERTKDLSIANKELIQEILDHKKSEKALQTEKAYLDLLFESAQEAVVLADQHHIILRVNGEFTRLFGYTESEAVGTHIDDLIVPAEFTEEAALLTKNVVEHNRTNAEGFRKRKDGTLINVSILASKITVNNKQVGVYGIYQDMTELKRAEKEKKELEEQLHQAQKMEAIGQLAGGVAHDFNNMLFAISGNANIIKKKFTANNPALSKYINRIASAAVHSADLTTKLLAFARKGKYEVAVVNIHETIQAVISLLEHTIDKRIRIIQHFNANPATIMGDSTQLQNAVLNMAVNAIDSMPDGGELKFTTDIATLDEKYVNSRIYKIVPGEYLKLTITDTGTGINAKIKNRIFEPFFTTKEQGKGTGLGLASVYGTVKNHDGSIELESEKGKGTAFFIYLPFVDKPYEETKNISDIIQKGSGRILIIDDEELIRDLSKEMLAEMGYTVTTCNDGEEAVEYYKKYYNKIDLLIIDLIMPKRNGYECFMEIKKINPKVKAIVSSGFSIDSEARKVINEGALGFIQKPFGMNELSQVVKDAIDYR